MLPVTDWEIEELRIRVPESLASQIGVPERIVRVPGSIDQKIRTRHPNILVQYLNLNELLEQWDAVRLRVGRVEVYLAPDDRGNRTMIVIGYDRRGSLNLISMYQVRERNWRNRVLIGRRTR